jgi:replicative DNA helicase
MIIIDYLMQGEADGKGGGEANEQEISSISRALKTVAKELNVPIVHYLN